VTACFHGVSKLFVLIMRLNSGIVNVGDLTEESSLVTFVTVSDCSLLLSVKTQQLAFFFGGERFECVYSISNFLLEDWQDRIVFVSHHTITDTRKCWLEGSVFNLLWLYCVFKRCVDLFDCTFSDTIKQNSKIVLFIAFNRVEHSLGAVMEMVFKLSTWVSQVIY
jgi:hypothetical protein